MTDDEAISRAAHAARVWGGLSEPPQLIKNRENIVLKGQLVSGAEVAIRLHRMGYQTAASIRGELRWTEALAAQGFPCSTPLRQQNGELITQLGDGQICSVISWITAEPIGAFGTALGGSLSEQVDLYRRIGALCADLHETTDALDLEPLERQHWSSEGFLGAAPVWGRFWENPALTLDEVELLRSIRLNAAQHFERISDMDQGLIHADLMQENLLQNDRLWLIDFDDCGYGYRAYDLATALIQNDENTNLYQLMDAILEGYKTRKQTSSLTQSDLLFFMMLRSIASCGWIISRALKDDPKQRLYVDRAMRCVRRFSQTTTS